MSHALAGCSVAMLDRLVRFRSIGMNLDERRILWYVEKKNPTHKSTTLIAEHSVYNHASERKKKGEDPGYTSTAPFDIRDCPGSAAHRAYEALRRVMTSGQAVALFCQLPVALGKDLKWKKEGEDDKKE